VAQEQLQFGICLDGDRKPHIKLNPSVKPEDKKRLSNQAQAIYVRLQQGPATTGELSAIACQYCARVNEVRHYLVKQGKMIDEVRGKSGNNLYQIVPLSKSKFWGPE
jgi:hypothetical protein